MKNSIPNFSILEKLWRKRFNDNIHNTFISLLNNHVPLYSSKSYLAIDDFNLNKWSDIKNTSNKRHSNIFKKNQIIDYFTSGKNGFVMNMRWDLVGTFGSKLDIYNQQADIMNVQFNPNQLGIVLIEDNPKYDSSEKVLSFLNNTIYKKIILDKSEKDNELIIRFLRKKTISILCSKPRILKRIMYLDKMIPRKKYESSIDIKAIRSSGDFLKKELKSNLEEWFKCHVFDYYKSQEGGAVAMSCLHTDKLHILRNRSYVEVFDGDKIKPYGEGRLVITNFENWGMPFVRYLTNDIVNITNNECKCGHNGKSIKILKSSDSPYFYFNKRIFNPSQFNKLFENENVHQFRVSQNIDDSLNIEISFRENGEESNELFFSFIKNEIKEMTNLNFNKIQIESVSNIKTIDNYLPRYHKRY